MLRDWEQRFPGRVDSIFQALSRVVPSHLLDRDAFDFVTLAATGVPRADGDIAFDADPSCEDARTAPAIAARIVVDAEPAD
jgi:tRNA 2-thiocytidine biosynthesis protein TtcA